MKTRTRTVLITGSIGRARVDVECVTCGETISAGTTHYRSTNPRESRWCKGCRAPESKVKKSRLHIL